MAGLAALTGAAVAKLGQPAPAGAINGDAVRTGFFALPTTVNDVTGVLSPSFSQLSKSLFQIANSTDSSIFPPPGARIGLTAIASGTNPEAGTFKVGVAGVTDDATGLGVQGVNIQGGVGVRATGKRQ
jgi:hypothetical protein